MINWFLSVLGYTLQNSSYNMDSYVMQGAVALTVLLGWSVLVLIFVLLQNLTSSARRRGR